MPTSSRFLRWSFGLAAFAIVLAGCATPVSAPEPTSRPSPPPQPTPAEPSPRPTATQAPTETPYPVFLDDFDAELQPGWSWVRENDALWSLTSEPGYLRLVLEGGRYLRNLLLRDVGSNNFQITTHVLFEPTSNYQNAGLIVYQEDGINLALGRAYCNNPGTCVGNGIYFDNVQSNAWIGTNFGTDTDLEDEAYLRLDKIGSSYTGYYSEDGANWTIIGTHDSSLTDPRVGLFAGNSNVVGATALFDYFMLMERP